MTLRMGQKRSPQLSKWCSLRQRVREGLIALVGGKLGVWSESGFRRARSGLSCEKVATRRVALAKRLEIPREQPRFRI